MTVKIRLCAFMSYFIQKIEAEYQLFLLDIKLYRLNFVSIDKQFLALRNA